MNSATQAQLLDAAERLFAERGFKSTSLRSITRRAHANLAAVNYHFGSKEKLTQAVFSRRLGPLNQRRLKLLDSVEGARVRPRLEAILYAFIAPTIYLWRDHPHFMQLAGRLHSEPDQKLHRYFLGQFEEVIRRFSASITRVLPRLPVPELLWRAHFLVGAMIYTWTSCRDLEQVSGGRCKVDDYDALIDRLVTFGAAGVRARLGGGGKK